MRSALHPRAVGVALAAFLALAVCPARADVLISDEARAHFKSGVNLLQDPGGAPRYEEAYGEFKAAYALSPSARILGNLGLCAMKLERDEEAIASYERYLVEQSDLDPAEREQVKADLTTLKAGLVALTVDVDVDGATLVDRREQVQGAPITNTYGPIHGSLRIGVRPGRHVLTLKTESSPPVTWEIEALPGSTQARAFTLKKPAPLVAPPPPPARPAPPPLEKRRPIPVAAFALGGASVALAVGGAVTGALALSKHSSFVTINDGENPAEATRLKSAGETLNIVTDVLFATALVGAAVTTYLIVARPTVEVPLRSARVVHLDAGWSPAGPVLGFSGRF